MKKFESRKDALVFLAAQILPLVLEQEGIQVTGRGDGIDVATPVSITLDYAVAMLDAIDHIEQTATVRDQQPCRYCRGGRPHR